MSASEMVCGEYTNYFNQIPDEIILEIFSNLQPTGLISVMKVCERFKKVASEKSLWKSSVITARLLKGGDFANIIQFPIEELEMSVRHFQDIASIDEIIESNNSPHKELNKLILSKMNSRGYQYVLNNCNPKHLILNDIYICRPLWNDLQFDHQSDKGGLEVVSMRGVNLSESYRKNHINCDFGTRRTLKEFDLGNTGLTVRQLFYILTNIPESVERLIWSNVLLRRSEEFINFRYICIAMIARRLPNLKLLGVSVECLKRQQDIIRLARLQFLETLRFCYCEKDVILSELVNILSGLRRVRTIQFVIKDDVPEESIEEFKRKLDKLKKRIRDFESNIIDPEVQYIKDTESICKGHYVIAEE